MYRINFDTTSLNLLNYAEQITGDMNAAKSALLQVAQRLRANALESDVSSLPFPHSEAFEGQKYVNRDNRTRNQGYSSYSSGYNTKNRPQTDSYGSYDDPQVVLTLDLHHSCVFYYVVRFFFSYLDLSLMIQMVSGSGYEPYTSYSAGHSPSAR